MNEVMLGLLLVLAVGHRAAAALAPARRRRREARRRRHEARAVRRLLLGEIHSGQKSFDDPGVRELLTWCRSREPVARPR